MLTAETTETTEYSPQSVKSGQYHIKDFTDDELAKIEAFARKHLNQGEWIVPLIAEQRIKEAIEWYVGTFLEEIMPGFSSDQSEKKISIENFKQAAQQYLVTYNLNGAKWFKEEFEEACLAKLQLKFPEIESVAEAGIDIISIKVTSSTGHQTYGKANVVDFDGSKMKGRHVKSIDDIGDRGITQKTIKDEALAAGALSVTTINLVEKEVPDTVLENERKTSSPDVALLAVAYQFLLGWGLDDGTRDITRELRTIVALIKEDPELAWAAYQGGQTVA